MPATRTVVPRSHAAALPTFFPNRVRIESPVYTTNPANGEKLIDENSWQVIYDNVPAAVTPVIRLGEEWRNWRLEFPLEQVTHRTELQGYYPLIKAKHRMIDETGTIHNITASHLSSHKRLTRIMSRVVSPEAIEGI